MELYTAFSLLLVVAAAFAYLNFRFLHLPSTIGLMVLALLSSLALVGLGRMGVPAVLEIANVVRTIDFHTVLMQVMLSFMLFAGGLHLDAASLGRQRLPVLTLSTVGTMLSTVLVATSLYITLPLFGLPLAFVYCLLFGALISPTDPIAVLGILTKAGIQKPLEIKIVGESLFNDGVGVVIFATVLSVAKAGAEALSVGAVLGLFLREALGGVALGLALGYGGSFLLRSIDNYKVEVLLTLALVAGGSSLATLLHTSGPLAMVMAGIIIGHLGRRDMSDVTQEYVDKFWEMLDEILNALLFVLMGLQMLVLNITPLYLLVGLLAVGLVLFARLISVGLPLAVLSLRQQFTDNSLTILTWGGLRGGISVALALSLPPTMPRDLLVGVTYVVVVFSILVQGLTIGPLAQYLQTKQQKRAQATKPQ
ncbi:sodium:proton antiporter [Hymenobacter sp.]|jgi:CPA1 family monovalent cation:H+ antiporter|uniref:cation:proton antiporter n=1 Tax=Hymenobacter sp. TaxID=1898978 RepID=UPI002EDA2C6D